MFLPSPEKKSTYAHARNTPNKTRHVFFRMRVTTSVAEPVST